MPDINSANINQDVATGRKIKGRETLIKTVSLLSPDHWSGFGLMPVRISWSVPYRYRPIAPMLYAGHARSRADVVRVTPDVGLVSYLWQSRVAVPMSDYAYANPTYTNLSNPSTQTTRRSDQRSVIRHIPQPSSPVARTSTA